MRTDDFDYPLPEELIAQAPASPRDSCRLMVVHRDSGAIEDRVFTEIGDYLSSGDLLVANETRVRAARLLGSKEGSGGAAELLLLTRREDLDPAGLVWECLVRPGRRLKPGARVDFPRGASGGQVALEAQVVDYVAEARGVRLVRLAPQGGRTLDEAIEAVGRLPLPPYITSYEGDLGEYQTIYATRLARSAAAPTAGLHFTERLIERLKAEGVGWANVELEVGIDTFRTVEEDDPRLHVMHTETYSVPDACVGSVRATQAAGGRVVAVGTTSVRSLESAYDAEVGALVARHGATTNLFLLPDSEFHVVDALVTNFHVPRSTLMMLVSAFAGRELIMEAYARAIERRYRMLSFGDAMLIL